MTQPSRRRKASTHKWSGCRNLGCGFISSICSIPDVPDGPASAISATFADGFRARAERRGVVEAADLGVDLPSLGVDCEIEEAVAEGVGGSGGISGSEDIGAIFGASKDVKVGAEVGTSADRAEPAESIVLPVIRFSMFQSVQLDARKLLLCAQ